MGRPTTIGHTIQDLTQGRPFVFVAVPYDQRFQFFETIERIVEDRTDLACINASDVMTSGHDLLEKIHALIERSELVIADVTESNPNVFCEVCDTVCHKTPVLLLAEEGKEIPTDLRGREVIRYSTGHRGAQHLAADLGDHLGARVVSSGALLRGMLEADRPSPNCLIASPKYPGERSRIKGQRRDLQIRRRQTIGRSCRGHHPQTVCDADTIMTNCK